MHIRYETRLKIFLHSCGPVLVSATGLALCFLLNATDQLIILFGSVITFTLFHLLFSRRKYITGFRLSKNQYTIWYIDRILTAHQADFEIEETSILLIDNSDTWLSGMRSINFFVRGKKTSFDIPEKRFFNYLADLNT